MLVLGDVLTGARVFVQLILPTVWWVAAHALTSAAVKCLVPWTVAVRADASTPFKGPHHWRGTSLRVAGWGEDFWWGWSCGWRCWDVDAFTPSPVPHFSNFALFWAA